MITGGGERIAEVRNWVITGTVRRRKDHWGKWQVVE